MQKKVNNGTINNGTITVPVPDHREIRIGTLQSIIRQSGIPRSEFENQCPMELMIVHYNLLDLVIC